ncbi:hypothetical protein C3L33_16888, partial [Rhododendron williamsianum]
MDYACQVFDVMPEKYVFLWNTLIRGHADLGPCQEAIVLYRDVHRIGLLPDRYTFPFVLRSCAVLSALREGREVHCNIVKSGFDLDVFVQSFLVTMYSQCGEILSSEVVFGEMVVRNIVSCTSMIAGYVQNGFFGKGLGVFQEITMSMDGYAIQLFHRMEMEKVEFDYITIVSVISACANLGALNTGKWVHELVRCKGLETNVSIANALIDIPKRDCDQATLMEVARQSQVLTFAHPKARIDEAEANLNHANHPGLLEILRLGG